MIAASFHELLKVIEIGAECIALKLDQLFLGFLNDEVSMCNVLMIKNIQEIVTVFLTEEIEDEEEERKEPPKAFSPSKDIAFKPSKVLPALLRIEEKLWNDYRHHMYFFQNFMFLVTIFDDQIVEKKLFPILDYNLRFGNRA